ncbi:MAG: hypothetical protein HPY50_09130 [Firmicutes bacterium]|nr:hypothetical protein [Bacillota bacterium]
MVERLERFISGSSSFYGEDPGRSPRGFKLNQGEQSVFGYFPSSTKAQKALQEIRNLGFETAQMDRVGLYGSTANPQFNNPLTGGLGLSSAAHSPVSGMAAENYGAAGGESFLLTVVADSARSPEVVRIIRENGGSV